MPAVQWIKAVRGPVLMDTTKARTRLGWEPAHTTHETLKDLVKSP